jgi:deoxyribonuclease V
MLDKAEEEFFSQIQIMIDAEPVAFPDKPHKICGVDVAYSDRDKRVVAAAVLLKNGDLADRSVYSGHFTFPYVSGLFYLHEGPFAVAAVNKLKEKPDLLCFDAHGYAHPRLRGLATVCGMVLGIPSIGIAKSALIGKTSHYKHDLDKLLFQGRALGFVTLRTQTKKFFWSPGYSASLKDLERVIDAYQEKCLSAMQEAHKLSRASLIKNISQ